MLNAAPATIQAQQQAHHIFFHAYGPGTARLYGHASPTICCLQAEAARKTDYFLPLREVTVGA